ncbi:MAG: carbohydrate kinase [Ignavibacteriaceae bacterium]|jgi:fructokinase|nr:carbohydrate kinase [Ignavibacteriaceae bacterium]
MNITSIGEILFDIYPDHKKLGGAPLNFIYHIKKLTASGNIISRVGKDVLGNRAANELRSANISLDYIQLDNIHSTGKANVTIDEEGEPEFNIDSDSAFDYIELCDENENLISSETDCLYFGTLAQRSEVSRNTIQSLFNRGAKCFVDLNLRNNFYNEDILISTLKAADFIKVNYQEMHILNDLLLQSDYNTEKAAYELMENFGINMIAVTRGKDGSSIFENSKRFDYSSVDVKVIDTTGAGDAFAAILCIGYLQGLENTFINKLANEFANEICKFEGALPKNDRIYEEFREQLGFF